MFHNIRILAQRHSVRVLSFFESEEERQSLKSVEPICESITPVERIPDLGAHWFSLAPFMVREFGTADMYAAVDKSLRTKRADVIQCEYLQMAQYRQPGIPSVLTIHETYSDNAYRAFLAAGDAIEKLRMFSRWMAMLNYEVSMSNAFDRVVTMTTDDARYLRSYARRANICAIPIGIDTECFQPHSAAPEESTVQVVFVGNYRHSPNVEAAEFLLEQIAPHFPGIEFVIAGSYLPSEIPIGSNSTAPGYIDDTRRLFQFPNTIFAAPLFSGTGQRVKLLEAFAMGAAVITTSLGAAGFPVINGKHAIISDTAQQFREAITALASSRSLRIELGQAARKMILDRFTWDRIGSQFFELVEGVAAN
jgi:glycosyltransferase involved in cell wall biosynthesis